MDFDKERFSGCESKWKEGTLCCADTKGTFAGPLQSLSTYNRSHLLKQLWQWQLFCTALISLNRMTTVGSIMNSLSCEIIKEWKSHCKVIKETILKTQDQVHLPEQLGNLSNWCWGSWEAGLDCTETCYASTQSQSRDSHPSCLLFHPTSRIHHFFMSHLPKWLYIR